MSDRLPPLFLGSNTNGVSGSSNDARDLRNELMFHKPSTKHATTSVPAQTSRAAFQQNNLLPTQAWPGSFPSGLPFTVPPIVDGSILPPFPPPHLANNQALNSAAPVTPSFPVPHLQQIHKTMPLSSQANIPTHSHALVKPVEMDTDKEDGELSDTSLPTGPASMQGRNRKKIQQPVRDRNQPTARNLKKHAKREERRGANIHRAGRGW